MKLLRFYRPPRKALEAIARAPPAPGSRLESIELAIADGGAGREGHPARPRKALEAIARDHLAPGNVLAKVGHPDRNRIAKIERPLGGPRAGDPPDRPSPHGQVF